MKNCSVTLGLWPLSDQPPCPTPSGSTWADPTVNSSVAQVRVNTDTVLAAMQRIADVHGGPAQYLRVALKDVDAQNDFAAHLLHAFPECGD